MPFASNMEYVYIMFTFHTVVDVLECILQWFRHSIHVGECTHDHNLRAYHQHLDSDDLCI